MHTHCETHTLLTHIHTPDSSPILPWGALPAEENYVKRGDLDKQLIDFSWKKYFVAITSHEIVFAANASSDVSDR